MNDAGALQALAVALPGATQYLWLTAVALAPLALVLLLRQSLPAYQRLPPSVASGIPLALGIIGATVAAIGCWLISTNGVWRDDSNLYLRASRAFSASIPLAEIRSNDNAPLAFDTLEAVGRIRTPGYAAGWYEDQNGRKVFVLWAGQPLTRIPTEGDFDLGLAIADPGSLQTGASRP
ncbi:hypothetical protein [Algiphilus sp.]|uniref:hypothetical protein n=1 Tax=Algiphilus sp. TaxID=1872431 RepID=UPI003BA9EFC5